MVFKRFQNTLCLDALSRAQRRAFLDNRADQLTGTIFSKCVFAPAKGGRGKPRGAEGS